MEIRLIYVLGLKIPIIQCKNKAKGNLLTRSITHQPKLLTVMTTQSTSLQGVDIDTTLAQLVNM
jgi:hypothetical protein